MLKPELHVVTAVSPLSVNLRLMLRSQAPAVRLAAMPDLAREVEVGLAIESALGRERKSEIDVRVLGRQEHRRSEHSRGLAFVNAGRTALVPRRFGWSIHSGSAAHLQLFAAMVEK